MQPRPKQPQRSSPWAAATQQPRVKTPPPKDGAAEEGADEGATAEDDGAAEGDDGGELAETGVESMLLVIAGIAVMVAGAMVLRVTRRTV